MSDESEEGSDPVTPIRPFDPDELPTTPLPSYLIPEDEQATAFMLYERTSPPSITPPPTTPSPATRPDPEPMTPGTTTTAEPPTTSAPPLGNSREPMQNPDPEPKPVVMTEPPPPPPPPKKTPTKTGPLGFVAAVVKVYGGRFAWVVVGLAICAAIAYAWVRWAPR